LLNDLHCSFFFALPHERIKVFLGDRSEISIQLSNLDVNRMNFCVELFSRLADGRFIQ